MISGPGSTRGRAAADSDSPGSRPNLEGALDDTPYPAVVLDVPSERIAAASPAATRLVAPDGGSVVGHNWEEYTTDSPTGGLDLFARGRLTGYESTRSLRRPDDAPLKVKIWVRAFDHSSRSRFALVVMVPEREVPASRAASTEHIASVLGIADKSLLIERISGEAEHLFGRPVAELVGRSVIELVAEDDVPNWLGALGDAASHHRATTLALNSRPRDGDAAGAAHSVRCDALILPLHPMPSCAFAFLPVHDHRPPVAPDELSAVLLRLCRTVQLAELARGTTGTAIESNVPGLSQLTTRELEIVDRLLRGDRVPVIAGALFLAQSTVRNHLAAVYTKLGVNSQQDLIALFRSALSHRG